jgi:hypothetical protein
MSASFWQHHTTAGRLAPALAEADHASIEAPERNSTKVLLQLALFCIILGLAPESSQLVNHLDQVTPAFPGNVLPIDQAVAELRGWLSA